MTEKDLTMPLVMLTTPAEPVMKVTPAVRRQQRSTRDVFFWLLHKAVILLFIALLSGAVYYFVSHYFIKSIKIVGTSMTPTLQEGGQYLLDPRAFEKRDPQYGEIVVIRDPGDHGLSVKRIIAVGGESVHFKDGAVYVNGQKLAEPYLPAHTRTFTYSQAKEQFITCGTDQYFVLGDNRLRSIDSRAYGPVSRKDVLGLVKN